MSTDNPTPKPTPAPRHRKTQVERDEEIEAIQQQSRHQHAEIQRPPEVPPASPGRALLLAGGVVALLVLAGGLTLFERIARAQALVQETEQSAVPTVAIVHPSPDKPDTELVLPATLQAYQESPIYARTNGYLLRWTRDIGSKVKKGELLAVIDTPEVDQELNQARATRQQVLAQLDLARISDQRWQNLRKSDSVSAQEADQQSSGYQQAKANLAASDANVRRLEELESFKNVYAPFSGVLTRRNVDAGALINSTGTGKELFDLAEVTTLRVFVNVPQAYANGMKPGSKATITLQEFPGEKFTGVIVRNAQAIDTATRTLLTEVDVKNPDGRLLPGSFGEVHFAVGGEVPRLTVPVNAMLFRSEGPKVAVVGQDGRAHLRPLNIGRDYGNTMEVLGGLEIGDQVIINPPDSLEDNQPVRLAAPAKGDVQPTKTNAAPTKGALPSMAKEKNS
jgi:RND family efflux transporter MFP subunit